MTIRELKDKIVSLGDTMDFSIDDVFSWRGSYCQPACSISAIKTTKEANLYMIDRLLKEDFYGWKGGVYTFSSDDEIHFEESWGSYSDGQYLIDFILDNSSNQDVYSIFRSTYGW